MNRIAAAWVGYFAFCLLMADGAALGAPADSTSASPTAVLLSSEADGRDSASDGQPWLSAFIQSDGSSEQLPDDEDDGGSSTLAVRLEADATTRALPSAVDQISVSRPSTFCASRAPPLA